MADPADTSIPGVSSLDLVPTLNREFNPTSASLTPEDYFVLTRCDGHTSFRQMFVIAGLPEQQVLASLTKLRTAGALLLPGESPLRRGQAPGATAPLKIAAPPATVPPVMSADSAAPLPPTAAPSGSRVASTQSDDLYLMEFGDLSTEQRSSILAKHKTVSSGDLFALLELTPDVDKKTIKRAYFKVSKDFHPDRFYGKKLGSFEPMLAAIFKAITQAYQVLDDDGKRAQYLAKLRGDTSAQRGSQSRGERAAEIFEHACGMEIMGKLDASLPYFAAAINLEPLPRYLRRAVEACIAAKELSAAEEYVKKLVDLEPSDAMAHRALGKVLKAKGQLDGALTALRTAAQIDPANIHIAQELDALERKA